MNKRNIEDIFRLTPVQHGMLLTDQTRETSMLVERIAYDLVGAIDAPRFRSAWQLLAARHGALRSGFIWKTQAEPVQFTLRAVADALEIADLRALSAEQVAAECASLAGASVVFDLGKPPLYRARLAMLPDGRARLFLAIHHLLIDGDSQFLLIRELIEAYGALADGGEWRPAPAAPYSAFAKWLRTRAADDAATQAFWQGHLAGLTTPTLLGEPVAAPIAPDGGHGQAQASLDAALCAALDRAARARGLAPNTLLQAGWALVLSAMSGAGKVAFGATLSERPAIAPSLACTVGLFINTVPFAVELADTADIPVADWLARLQDAFVGVRDHGHAATAQIHDWSQVPGALPLFDSLLVVENYASGPPPAVADGDDDALRLSDFGGEGARTGYPLTLLVALGARTELKAVYQRRAIGAEGAGLLLDNFARTLAQLVAALEADATVASLRLLLADLPRPAVHLRERRVGATEPAVGETETRLLAIWRDVLGLQDIGVTDDWIVLGGHSLLAARLLERMRAELAGEVRLSDLLGCPTVRSLALLLDERGGEPCVTASLPVLVTDADAAFEPFPLTDIQQAYWAGRSDLFQGGGAVATHSYMELNGPMLDPERFHEALGRLIRRHPMLRMVVDASGMQRVLADVPEYRVPLTDLRALCADERHAALADVRARMSHEVLASDRWPLFNIAASRIGDDIARLHVSIDMLIVDGSSQHILFRDLAAIYLGREDELPPLRLAFRDYAIAVDAARATPAYAAARDYWHGRIAALPLAPRLPLAIDPDALTAPRFVRRQARLDAGQWRALREAARAHGLTGSAVLCTVYADVLRRWSEEPDFTLNLTLFNRLPIHPDVDQIVGDFTATMLLEASDGQLPTFVERARALQKRSWRDLDHRQFTGIEVLRELGRRRGGSRAAAMPVVFTSALVLDDAAAGEDQQASPLMGHPDDYASGQTSQVWLDFQVLEEAGGLTMLLDAVDALFPDGMVAALFAALERTVAALAADGDWTRPAPELLPDDQVARRAAVNATGQAFALAPLAEFVRDIADDDTRPALLTADVAIDRATLARWVRRLAADLQHAGVRSGELVVIEMEKGWPQAVAALAICLAGGAYVPVDARWPLERRCAIHAQVAPRAVLTDDATRPTAAEATPVAVDRALLEGLPDAAVASAATLDDLAYVIFTSGSTGTPKGVVIDHRGAANTIADLNARLGLTPDDRVLGLSSLSFDLSVYDIFGVLAAGGALVLPDAGRQQDPAHWGALMRDHRVTLFNGVPALMQVLVDHLEAAREPLPPALRTVMMSGDWIPVALPDRIRALAACRPAPALYSLGGATEASIWSVLHAIGEVYPAWRSIPYGTPLANQTMHVLTADFAPCPDHVAGDLYIGGVGLAKGYWHDEARTGQAFVRHPRTGQTLYRTGDQAAYGADGVLEFRGRKDSQVKLRGHRIELGEIETAFAALPGVRGCVAALTGGDPLQRQLAAYVLLAEPAAAMDEAHTLAGLRAAAAGRLPGYMQPAFVLAIEALPLSANGKVDRARLPAPPVMAGGDIAAVDESGGDRLSTRLADLWEELLGTRPAVADAHFLELGGNSVSMLRLIARLRAEDGVEIDVRRFFDDPSFGAMSRLVEAGRGGATRRISTIADIAARERLRLWFAGLGTDERATFAARYAVPESDVDTQVAALHARGARAEAAVGVPLSFEQERMWFGARMRDAGQYNLFQVVDLPASATPAAVRALLAQLVTRHEGLRTRFVEQDGEVRQFVDHGDPHALFTFAASEARKVPAAQLRAALIAQEQAWRFDLARGPMLRATFAHAADGTVLLAVNIPHIVSDGWSLGNLMSEMSRIHADEGATLPALPVSYADFALWQRWWVRSEEAQVQADYWRRQLAELPLVGFSAPQEAERGPGTLRLRLGETETAALKALAATGGTTLFAALASVLGAAVNRAIGARAFGIGTSVTTRPAPELEPVFGLFLNQMVLRLDLADNPTPRRLIEAMRTTVNAAFAHALLPFDAVVAATARSRARADMPLFNLFLTLQNAPQGEAPTGDVTGPEAFAAKFDFSMFCHERAGGIDALVVTDPDRVAGADAQRIARAFTALASAFADAADRPLNLLLSSDLEPPMDATSTAAPAPATALGSRLKLGERRRRGIDLNQLELTREQPHEPGGLPYVVEALQDVDFAQWARDNAARLEQRLLDHGAILFRGFGIRDKDALQTAQGVLCSDAILGYGDLPEEAGSRQIYKSTPYPNDRMILFHNESSHQARWPSRQFFACVTASEEGGETPIVDCRRVAEALGAATLAEFEERGLRYVRTFIDGLDVSWSRFFKTEDRAEVARLCALAGDDCRWFADGTLQVSRQAPAVLRHPVTGERAFFNQIQLHEPHFLAPAEREAVLSVYGRERLPRNVVFGDGEPIPAPTLDRILDVTMALSVALPWRAGDMLMLDNLLVAHARNPFRGDRKIIVALGNPQSAVREPSLTV